MNKLEKVKLVYTLMQEAIPHESWVKLAGLRIAKEIVEALDRDREGRDA